MVHLAGLTDGLTSGAAGERQSRAHRGTKRRYSHGQRDERVGQSAGLDYFMGREQWAGTSGADWHHGQHGGTKGTAGEA